MGDKERALWRKSITRVILKNRSEQQVPSWQTPLDPAVRKKLERGDAQLVGEFAHYRWFEEDREELRAVAGGEGEPLHGKYIYVLALNRRLYVYPEPPGAGGGRDDEFRHSAFVAGRPVLSAGQLFVWNGRVVLVDNSSGHYKPQSMSMKYILSWLSARVDMSDAIVTTYGADFESCSYMAASFVEQGLTAQRLNPLGVPDVESVFKYILYLEEEGVYFSSFLDAEASYREMQREKREKVLAAKRRQEEEAERRKQQLGRSRKAEEQRKAREIEAAKKKAARDEQRRQMLADMKNRGKKK